MMMRGLVAAGSVLVLLGAGILIWVLGATPTPELASGVGEVQVAAGAAPSRVWAILAGLILAAGAACVGIGMNQWRQGRPRTIRH